MHMHEIVSQAPEKQREIKLEKKSEVSKRVAHFVQKDMAYDSGVQ